MAREKVVLEMGTIPPAVGEHGVDGILRVRIISIKRLITTIEIQKCRIYRNILLQIGTIRRDGIFVRMSDIGSQRTMRVQAAPAKTFGYLQRA